MPFVVNTGTGTYTFPPYTFRPGGNECDDEKVLAHVRDEAPDWLYVTDTLAPDEDELEAEATAAAEAEAEKPTAPDAWAKFRGRDNKFWYHAPTGDGETFEQVGPFDDEKEADAAIAAAQDAAKAAYDAAQAIASEEKTAEKVADAAPIPTADEVAAASKEAETGTLKSEDLGGETYPCNEEGCAEVLTTSGERANHERVKHPKKKAAAKRKPVKKFTKSTKSTKSTPAETPADADGE
jgi:hypothetical protein